jgi:hypothetical protein
MTMAGVILFSLPQVVQVVQPSNPAGGVMITSFHHTRSDFKVFWNVDNDIDFFIRDYDRKIKSVGQDTYSIMITNPKTGKLLSQVALTVVDPAVGHLRLTLTAQDSILLPIGTLRYSIIRNAAGKNTLMFTDRDHGPQSTLEVKYGPIPAQIEPEIITHADFATIDGSLRAGAFQGPSILSDASNMRTFLISCRELTGQIVFEASLTETPPSTASDWFVAHQEPFLNYTGCRTVNLEGNYSWVRLVLVEITGSMTEILMK